MKVGLDLGVKFDERLFMASIHTVAGEVIRFHFEKQLMFALSSGGEFHTLQRNTAAI